MCLELTPPSDRIVAKVSLTIGPCFPILMPEPQTRYPLMLKLPVDRGIFLALNPKDSRNNPISLDDIDGETITVNSSNTEIITAELTSDQKIKVVPTGTLGTAQVNVEFFVPTLARAPFTGLLEITTVPGSVASFSLDPVPDSMFPI